MKRRLRIGYLNSYMVAPLLVAEYHGWLDKLGWTLDPSMEIGWSPLMKGLLLGNLDGAVVPPCLPWFPAFGESGEAAIMSACSAMAFGGTRVVCSERIEEALGSGNPPGRLRFGTTGQLGCEYYYMRRWLHGMGRADWVESLLPVQVAVTQNLNFLEADVIDLFLCMEPWGRPAASRRSARILLSGDPFEEVHLSRVLVLRNDCLSLDADLLHRLLPIIERSAKWLNEASSKASFAEILSRSGCNLAEQDLFSTLKEDTPIPAQCGFSYLRPGSGNPALTDADLHLSWKIFSEGVPFEEAPGALPETGTRLFRIPKGKVPLLQSGPA